MTGNIKNAGFTLLEVLLTVSILTILTGMSVPVYNKLLIKNDLDQAGVELAQSFRRAESLSQSVDGDSTWGVRVQPGSITLFKGASYVVRDSAFDEVYSLSPNISIGGNLETVFNKFTGEPQSQTTVTLTGGDDTRTITVNAKGAVFY